MSLEAIARRARRIMQQTVANEGKRGLLGKSDGTVKFTDQHGVTHPGRHWARVNREGKMTEIEVRNTVTPPHPNLPVRIAERGGVQTVIGLDGGAAFQYTGGQALLPAHSHDRLGPNPHYATGLSFLPLAVTPTKPPDLTVTVQQGWYRYGGDWKHWDTGASGSLAAYVPSGQAHHFVIIALDRANNAIEIVDGADSSDVLGVATSFTASDIAAITIPNDAYLPLAAVRLVNGQTTIKPPDIFMDLRLWGGEAAGFDINSLTEETDVDGAADYIPFYDDSAGANRKVLPNNLPGGRGGLGLLYSQTVDETVADTTDETSLLSAGRGSKTLEADALEQGTTIRLSLAGHLSDTGNPTLNIKVKLGSTEVCSTGADNLNTSVTEADWSLEVLITCRSTGATGAVVAGGLFEHDDGTHFGLVKTSETTIDTTGTLAIDVTATWGTADAANTITCQEATIEKLASEGLAPVAPTGLTATEA